jgi:lysozyme
MDINKPQIISMLKEDEGLRYQVYDDSTGQTLRKGDTLTGHPTIGVGRELSMLGLSDEEVHILLSNDIDRVIMEAESFPWYKYLNEVRAMTVISMLFNLGKTKFNQFVKFQSALLRQDWEKASEEMMDSRAAKQLPIRYTKLSTMMRSGKID